MATARPGYGNTWWGKQWLDALTHIDYDNRLPRGRAYANKGAVKDLRIADGVIHAKVAGSRPQPYTVSIGVPPIPEKDARRLLDAIAADPALIARLLNRELDPALLELAGKLGIAVFPRQWKDLAMQCSCPDWAVPCKHLAAAIYLLSREIDGNPFLVFALRGVDLAAGLKSRDVLIEREAGAALPTVAELLAAEAEEEGGATGTTTDLDQLDFSLLPELADALLQVLPAKPAFAAAGDFRATTQRVLTRVAKAARQALDAAPPAEAAAQASRLHADDKPRIALDAACSASLSGLAEVGDWPALADALDRLDATRLPDLQPELAALHAVRLLALHLLARGAVVPQVFALGERRVGLPACLAVAARGRRRVALAPATQATVLCSLFLDHYRQRWSAAAAEKPPGDKTVVLFFGSGRATYDGPGEGAVAAGIQAWLARFHLARRAGETTAAVQSVERPGLARAALRHPADRRAGRRVLPAAQPPAAAAPVDAGERHVVVGSGRRRFPQGRPAFRLRLAGRRRRPPADARRVREAAQEGHRCRPFQGRIRLDHVLLLLLYNTGARISEIVGVKVGEVVLDDGAARVHLHGKGRKQRSVPLWRSTVRTIRAGSGEIRSLIRTPRCCPIAMAKRCRDGT